MFGQVSYRAYPFTPIDLSVLYSYTSSWQFQICILSSSDINALRLTRALTLITITRIRIPCGRYIYFLRISNHPWSMAQWNSSMPPCRSALFLKPSEAVRQRLGYPKVVLAHGERGITRGQPQTSLKYTTTNVNETNPARTDIIAVIATAISITDPGRLRAQARYPYPSCPTRVFCPSMEMSTPKYRRGVSFFPLFFRYPFFQTHSHAPVLHTYALHPLSILYCDPPRLHDLHSMFFFIYTHPEIWS